VTLERFREEAVAKVAQAAGLPAPDVSRVLDVPAPERGDFAFPTFSLAKERKAPPPKIAAEIASAISRGGRIERAVAVGPYVNLFVDRPRLVEETIEAASVEGTAYGSGAEGVGKSVVVDYSAPNVAKPLAFHHLRSTMIGNSLARLYAARGWKVVGVNHLGDWGTGFGKLLLAIELWGTGALDSGDPRLLNDLYVRINAEIKEDAALEDRARAWFKRLEDGDEPARALWRRCVDISMKEFAEVYRRLGVRFDFTTGESFYEDRMDAVVAELHAKGLAVESEGALVVRLDEEGMPPCLLRKSDGATLSATRDLAAATYRHATFQFDRALYLTDAGQSLHFRQWIRVLEKAGHAWATTIRHVPFGVVLIGGQRGATRSGKVALLLDVLDEAVAKVTAVVREKSPDVEDASRVAEEVGIGAVVFNDLKNRRTNDVEFDLDAILSFEGKTGPYVMYSHARACSILRKAGEAVPPAREGDGALLSDPAEYALARLVSRFPDRVARAVEGDDPSEVAQHLLDVCEAFHAYHTRGGRDPALRVLSEDPRLRGARLRLVDAVRRTLANGLHLLGIAAPEKM
jgi:arginyl-tRNA synthetase